MADLLSAGPSRARTAVMDAVMVLWLVGCVTLGVLVRDEILGLTGLVTSVERVAGQAEGIAESIGGVELPLVGGALGGVAEDARVAGSQARRDARTARTSIEDLSTLLGVAVAVVALGPVLALYLPLRVRWWRRSAAEARLRARAEDDPELLRLLAQRRLLTMPADVLERREDRPWGAPPNPQSRAPG